MEKEKIKEDKNSMKSCSHYIIYASNCAHTVQRSHVAESRKQN